MMMIIIIIIIIIVYYITFTIGENLLEIYVVFVFINSSNQHLHAARKHYFTVLHESSVEFWLNQDLFIPLIPLLRDIFLFSV